MDFTLHTPITTNVITWEYHLDESTMIRYDIIWGCDLLIELGLNLKLSDHGIKSDDGLFKVSKTPMVDLGTYGFLILNKEEITPE